MIRVAPWAPIVVVLIAGSACYGTAAGLGAAWAPAGALAMSKDPAPEASSSASVIASAAPPVAPSASVPPIGSAEPVPTGPPAACRGARLTLSGVAELCGVEDGTKVLPEVVKVELSGPKEVGAGELANYEIRLVNRGQEPLLLTFGTTCTWDLEAPAAIRHESSKGGGDMATTCSAKARYFEVVLEPGGMVVEPVTWRARGELYVDGSLKKREPLAPGKYTLRTSTWLYRGKPGEDRGKSHGAFVSADGELAIVVR